jgi:hypothetical protein
VVRSEQGLLDGVLRGTVENPRAGPDQPAPMPADQDLERCLIAQRGELCEPLVALQTQER